MISVTPPEHEHSAAIDEAAAWLSTTPERQRPRPLLPHLQKAFGLTVTQAIAAIREANLRRARAA